MRSAEEMAAAGLDVRFDNAASTASASGGDVIDRDAFEGWLVLKGLQLAGDLLKWWVALEEAAEGELDCLKYRGDSVAGFFRASSCSLGKEGMAAASR